MRERITLEVGAIAGILLVIAGLVLTIVALAIWGDTGFNRLDYRETLRIVIPAGTMLILGVQTILASFFLSILELTPSRTRTGC
jgi:hypothetical protein